MQLAMDGWELGNNICVGLALAIFAVFVIGCTMYWIKGR